MGEEIMPVIYTDKELPKRSKNDFYETPLEVAEACLEKLKSYSHLVTIDAGCGSGIWGLAANRILRPSILVGYDIEEYPRQYDIYDRFFNLDFLRGVFKADLVIGNPPFSLAEPFVRKGLEMLGGRGCLLYLLPLSFLEGIGRGEGLFKEHPPAEVWVSSRRIDFTGKKNNPNSYAFFLWVPHAYPEAPEIRWLSWDWKYDRDQIRAYLKGETDDLRIS
jgi:hypothetical protein